jgi:hypothetical protein
MTPHDKPHAAGKIADVAVYGNIGKPRSEPLMDVQVEKKVAKDTAAKTARANEIARTYLTPSPVWPCRAFSVSSVCMAVLLYPPLRQFYSLIALLGKRWFGLRNTREQLADR